MNIPFNQRSNPLFHGEHPFCMAGILSGFSLPLLHFPRERRSQEIWHSQAQRFPVCFFSCFSATYPMKTRERFDFQWGLWGILSCRGSQAGTCWTTQFVPSFDPFPACPRISGLGYQENQLQEEHPPLQERFGQKLGMWNSWDAVS